MQISFEEGTIQSPPLVDSCFCLWRFLIPFRSAPKFALLMGINLGLGRLYQPNSFPDRPLSTRIIPTQIKRSVAQEFGVKPSSSTTRHFAVSFCRYMPLWWNEMTVTNCTGNACCYFSWNELLQGPWIIQILEGLCQVICHVTLLRI